jgi:Leucine-rich repeat (LRR) protein
MSLEWLELNDTGVSDLTPLSGLTSLKKLELRRTLLVSDVTPLSELTKLKKLRLEGTSVSKEEIDNLKRALPQCNISH